MKKRLFTLLLALSLCYVLLLPAAAVTETQSATTTLTMEVPEITYTLSVPSAVTVPFEGTDEYREIGKIEIKDVVRFLSTNFVSVTASHTDFTCSTTETKAPYQLMIPGKLSGTSSSGYLTLAGTNYIGFYPTASTTYDQPSVGPQNATTNDSALLVLKFNSLSNLAQLDPGTYTSTITFTATLH